MVLQFIGIFTVVSELRARGRDVGAMGLASAVRQFFADWPRPVTPLTATAVGESVCLGDLSDAISRFGYAPGASLDERLTSTEQNMALMDKDLFKMQRGLEAEGRARALADKNEADARVTALQGFRQSLDDAAAKTLPFSLFGVIWLAVGVGLSSTSAELAKWIALLFP